MTDVSHIVGLSGGKDSTCMAVLLRETMPETDFTYVITPTGDELPEMVDHWKRLGELLGKPLTVVTCGKSLKGINREYNALPNHRMRFCTRELKIIPFQQYAFSHAPAILYVGLRADEEFREGMTIKGGGEVYGSIEGVEQRFPLREHGFGVRQVWDFLDERGIVIPQRTDCARCFWQTIPEWYLLWKRHPEIYADAEQEEKEHGHTYRSPGRDTWPASLEEMRKEFERGRKIPNLKQHLQLRLCASDRSDMCRACSL